MKNKSGIKIVLIISMLILIGLLTYYLVKQIQARPKVVSQLELYQQELMNR